jgi:hypothetical protein
LRSAAAPPAPAPHLLDDRLRGRGERRAATRGAAAAAAAQQLLPQLGVQVEAVHVGALLQLACVHAARPVAQAAQRREPPQRAPRHVTVQAGRLGAGKAAWGGGCAPGDLGGPRFGAAPAGSIRNEANAVAIGGCVPKECA